MLDNRVQSFRHLVASLVVRWYTEPGKGITQKMFCCKVGVMAMSLIQRWLMAFSAMLMLAVSSAIIDIETE